MIEINLLPEELKVKAEASKKTQNLDPRYFLYLIPFTVAVLLSVHLYLGGWFLIRRHELARLEKTWQGLEANRRQLEEFNKENTVFRHDTSMVKTLLGQRVAWSQRLNKLSHAIPSGIWLTELSLTTREFTLRGSVISLEKDEMALVKRFVDSLKEDSSFFDCFSILELSSVQRKTIGSFDVLDFTLIGSLK
jgi:Tfp pilus assembly protein PilN